MKKCLAELQALAGTAVVARIKRKSLDTNYLDGFVVDLSKKFLLLQVIEGNNLRTSGYTVLRLSDISAVRRDDGFVSQALSLGGIAPVLPEGIELSDWRSLMISVQDRYALLSLELEVREPGCAFIGRIEKLKPQSVTLAKVNPKARWSGTEKFAFKHITRLDFDSGYMNSLARVCDYYDNAGTDV